MPSNRLVYKLHKRFSNFVKIALISLLLINIISITLARADCIVQGEVLEQYDGNNNDHYIKLKITEISCQYLSYNKGDIIVIAYHPDNVIGKCVEARGSFDPAEYAGVWIDFFAGSDVETITCPEDDQTPPPKCIPGPVGSPQCSGNAAMQQYQDANCNKYWQTIDDCNRYMPSKCCNNGRCDKCGEQETYRCVNNVVQRLVINNGVEEWQVFDDCNSYSPPRRCIGGACVKIDDTTPEEVCDQAECQSQSIDLGQYTKDEKTYHRYTECNCVENKCQCETKEKELAIKEIEFIGTAIKFHKGDGSGAPDYWTVKVEEVISGPQPCNDQLDVITKQAINVVWGYADPNIQENYKVKVYGIYKEQVNDGCNVVLYGSKNYYMIDIYDDLYFESVDIIPAREGDPLQANGRAKIKLDVRNGAGIPLEESDWSIELTFIDIPHKGADWIDTVVSEKESIVQKRNLPIKIKRLVSNEETTVYSGDFLLDMPNFPLNTENNVYISFADKIIAYGTHGANIEPKGGGGGASHLVINDKIKIPPRALSDEIDCLWSVTKIIIEVEGGAIKEALGTAAKESPESIEFLKSFSLLFGNLVKGITAGDDPVKIGSQLLSGSIILLGKLAAIGVNQLSVFTKICSELLLLNEYLTTCGSFISAIISEATEILNMSGLNF